MSKGPLLCVAALGAFLAGCAHHAGEAPAPASAHTSHGGTPFVLASEQAPLVLVPVRIGDAGPFTFVLDTGASGTLVSTRTAAALHLDARPGAIATGAGGTASVSTATIARMSVGGTVVDRLSVAVADLPQVEKAIGRTIDGVVGYDFFGGKCVVLDYTSRVVRFADHCG
jgi:predicted aspartyl protease